MPKGYKLEGEHRLPIDDEIEHVPYDFCPCEPFAALYDNRIVWIHEPQDARDVVEQAEVINKIVGWTMFQEQQQQFPKEKMKYYPFEQERLIWPNHSKR